MSHKFEIYKDKKGEYRARFKYNSEVIWSSEGYPTKRAAQRIIETVKKNAPAAPIDDPTSQTEDLKRRLANAPVPAANASSESTTIQRK